MLKQVMQGRDIEEVGTDNIDYPVIVTEKLDGVRCLLVKESGESRFYSRSGNEFELPDIAKATAFLPDNRIYDGELIAIGEYDNNLECRQKTESITNGKDAKRGLTFNIFDTLTLDEWNGTSETPTFKRKGELRRMFENSSEPLVKAIPILGLCNNFDEFMAIADEVYARNGEGVMLNVATTPYEHGKTDTVIKVKRSEDHIGKIVGFASGKGKYEGTLGALKIDCDGVQFKIGTGLTNFQRTAIWSNQAAFIGATVEFETFGKSANKNGIESYNCPVLKTIFC